MRELLRAHDHPALAEHDWAGRAAQAGLGKHEITRALSAAGAADDLAEPERLRYLGRVAERALRLETLETLGREPRLAAEPFLAERVWVVHAHHHGLAAETITHHLLGLGDSPRDRSDFERLLRALEEGRDINRRWIEPHLIIGPLDEAVAPLRSALRASARALADAANELGAEPREVTFRRFEHHRAEFLDLERQISRVTAGLEPTPQLRAELDALRDLYARSIEIARPAEARQRAEGELPTTTAGAPARPEVAPRPAAGLGEPAPSRRQLERTFEELSSLLGFHLDPRPLAETQARLEHVLDRLAAASAAHQRAYGKISGLSLDIDDHQWPAVRATFERLNRPAEPGLETLARANLAARLTQFTANPHTGGLTAEHQRWADHALLSGLSPRYVQEIIFRDHRVPWGVQIDPGQYPEVIARRAHALAERLRPRLEARLSSFRTAALARLPGEMRTIVQAAGVLTGRFTPLGAAGFLIGLVQRTQRLLERAGRAQEGRSR